MAKDYYNMKVPSGKYIYDIPRVDPDIPSIVVSPKVIGIPQMMTKLKIYTKKMERAGERGVEKAAKHLLRETLKVTPKDTGKLREAGTYVVRKLGKQSQGIVYFDDTVAPYAIYVHEDLTKKHKPPTMAKFLQRTMYRLRGELNQIIIAEIRKARP